MELGVWIIGATSFLLTLCVVPPLAKCTVAPLTASMIATAGSAYLETLTQCYFSIWSGILTLENVVLKQSFLYALRLVIPLPIHIQSVVIQSIQIQLPHLRSRAKCAGTIQIHIQGIRVELQIADSKQYEPDAALYRDQLVANKITQANVTTTMLEEYLQRKNQEYANQEQPPQTWTQKLISSMVEKMEFTVNDVVVQVKGEEPATPQVPIELTLASLLVESDPSTTTTKRLIAIRNLFVTVGGYPICGFPVADMEIVLPSIMDVVLSPLPLDSKRLQGTITMELFLLKTAPDLMLHLTRYYVAYVKYINFISHLELEEQNLICQNPTLTDEVIQLHSTKYTLNYDVNRKESDIFLLERQFSLPLILELRQASLKWNDRQVSTDKAAFDDVCAFTQYVEQERKPLRTMQVDFQMGLLDLSFFENNINHQTASVMLSGFHVNMLKTESTSSTTTSANTTMANADHAAARDTIDSITTATDTMGSTIGGYNHPTLTLALEMTNFEVISFAPSFDRSETTKLITHCPDQPLLDAKMEKFCQLRMEQYEANDQIVLDLQLHSLQLMGIAKPIEFLALYMDRLVLESMERLAVVESTKSAEANSTEIVSTDAPPSMSSTTGSINSSGGGSSTGKGSSSNVGASSQASAKELSTRSANTTTTTPTCAVFKGKYLDINVSMTNFKFYMVPPYIDKSKMMLEFVLSMELLVKSQTLQERVSFSVYDIAFQPKSYKYEKEDSKFPTISNCLNVDTSKPLLAPMNIRVRYELSMKKEFDNHFTQKISLEIPDILVQFSHLHLCILVASMNSLTAIQTTTPEQLKKRQVAQRNAIVQEHNSKVQRQIALAKAQFDAIDVDHSNSINMDELQQLLLNSMVGYKLLESELRTLASDIFQKIDWNHNNAIDFDEFEQYLMDSIQEDSLTGYVDLFCGEYVDTRVIEQLFGSACTLSSSTNAKDNVTVGNSDQDTSLNPFLEWLNDPKSAIQFWTLFEYECHVTKYSLENQPISIVQRKLIRLVGHYHIAKCIWQELIQPELEKCLHIETSVDASNAGDTAESGASNEVRVGITASLDWALSPQMLCGGLVEFETASKMLLSTPQQNNMYATTYTEDDEDESAANEGTDGSGLKQYVDLETDIAIGSTLFILRDLSLPSHQHRAEFLLNKVNIRADLHAIINDDMYSLDRIESEWNVTIGCHVTASCFSDLAQSMEKVIEPWKICIGVCCLKNEDGISCYVESSPRFQLNMTSSFMKVLNRIPELFDNQYNAQESDDADKNSVILRDGVKSLRSDAEDKHEPLLYVHNVLGLDVEIIIHNQLHNITDAKTSLLVVDTSEGLNDLQIRIPRYGQLKKVMLPLSGSCTVYVPNDQDPKHKIPIVITCQLNDPLYSSVVLQSNICIVNYSSLNMDSKCLHFGLNSAENAAKSINKSALIESGYKLLLPIAVFMGMTEIYFKKEQVDEWSITTKIDNASFDQAIANTKQKDLDMEQLKGTIIRLNQVAMSSTILKTLAPSILLKQNVLQDSSINYEVSILPSFVIQNSLPYMIEYNFIEYRPDTTANNSNNYNGKLNMDDIEALLLDPTRRSSGTIPSGHSKELANISSLTPGYVSFRLINTIGNVADTSNARYYKTGWSKPMLMAIHATIERFTSPLETHTLESGITLDVERLSLPHVPRLMKVSVPYWIINNTNLALKFRVPKLNDAGNSTSECYEIAPSPAFQSPVMLHIPKKRLAIQPVEFGNDDNGAFMKTKQNDDVLSKEAVCHSFDSTYWSEFINVGAVQTNGEIQCGFNMFGTKIQALLGIFDTSIAVHFTPRYVLQNQTFLDFQLQTICSENMYSTIDQVSPQLNASSNSHGTTTGGGGGIPITQLTKLNHVVTYTFSPVNGTTTTTHHGVVNNSKLNRYFVLGLLGEQMSGVISATMVGDFYLQVFCSKRQRGFIIQVTIEMVESGVFVTLTDSSSSPPYQVENYTIFPITIRQISTHTNTSTNTKRLKLNRGEIVCFAYDEVSSKKHLVEIEFQNVKQVYDADLVGFQKPFIVKAMNPSVGEPKTIEYVVEVIPLDSTRVLRIISNESHIQELHLTRQIDINTVDKWLYASCIDVCILGIGVSLYDALPQEILFISLDQIRIRNQPKSLAWEFSIYHIQVDNMLEGAKLPVIMNPIDSGYSTKQLTAEDNTPVVRPFFKVTVIAMPSPELGVYKLLDIQLNPISVKIDMQYILQVVALIEPESNAQLVSVSNFSNDAETLVQAPLPAPPHFMDVKALANCVGNGLSGASTATVMLKKSISMMYIETFQIHPFSILLECSIKKSDLVQHDSSSFFLFEVLKQVVGIIGSQFSGSPSFSFQEVAISQCFTSADRLKNQIISNYTRQGILQAYRLIGSADILGDPIGLVEDLGTGVIEFLKITTNEVTGNAQTRGAGVKALGQTLAKTGASTVAKMTGGLDRFMDGVSDVAATNNSGSSGDNGKGPNGDGSNGGGSKDQQGGFVSNFAKGITGIVTKPMEGARKGGVGGLLTGAAQGIAGPGVVLLKSLTSATHHVAVGMTDTVVDRAPFQGRRRLAKKFKNRKLITYQGNCLNHNATKDKSKQQFGKEVIDEDEEGFAPSLMQVEIVNGNGLTTSGSCNASCHLHINEDHIFSTDTLYNNNNPQWHCLKKVNITNYDIDTAIVKFKVKDSYTAMSKTIGIVKLPLRKLIEDFTSTEEGASSISKWVENGVKPPELVKAANAAARSSSSSTGTETSVKNKNAFIEDTPRSERDYFIYSRPSAHDNLGGEQCQLLMTVVCVKDLKVPKTSNVFQMLTATTNQNNLQPSVLVQIGDTVQRTSTKSGSEAKFNESFTFKLKEHHLNSVVPVVLKVKDTGKLKDESLGYADLNFEMELIPRNTKITRSIALMDKARKVSNLGTIDVQLEVIGKGGVRPSMNDGSDNDDDSSMSSQFETDHVVAGRLRIFAEFL